MARRRAYERRQHCGTKTELAKCGGTEGATGESGFASSDRETVVITARYALSSKDHPEVGVDIDVG